ncbi:hypothetical protein [Aliarcobacter butzleri]|uniref:hypothetical protein n=1 Tax=Aliarcobacter butzleri TaxID=28197 RepID=UPI002B253CAB|nr:hypothetical protein [Aliarcobacter butzleri]
MPSETRKPVSCYLNLDIKAALEKEVSQLKFEESDKSDTTEGEDRHGINKNIERILTLFLDKYENEKIEKVENLIVRTLTVKNILDGKKEMKKRINVSNKQFPLKLFPSFSKRVDSFITKLSLFLGFKIKKTTFYNFVLLNYFIEKKHYIVEKELEFWTRDSFKLGINDNSLKEILESPEVKSLLVPQGNKNVSDNELEDLVFTYFNNLHNNIDPMEEKT